METLSMFQWNAIRKIQRQEVFDDVTNQSNLGFLLSCRLRHEKAITSVFRGLPVTLETIPFGHRASFFHFCCLLFVEEKTKLGACWAACLWRWKKEKGPECWEICLRKRISLSASCWYFRYPSGSSPTIPRFHLLDIKRKNLLRLPPIAHIPPSSHTVSDHITESAGAPAVRAA